MLDGVVERRGGLVKDADDDEGVATAAAAAEEAGLNQVAVLHGSCRRRAAVDWVARMYALRAVLAVAVVIRRDEDATDEGPADDDAAIEVTPSRVDLYANMMRCWSPKVTSTGVSRIWGQMV
jgi:hypothetical protein